MLFFRLKGEASFRRVAIEYLNLFLGSSEESKEYWNEELSDTIIHSFFYHSKQLPTQFMEIVASKV